MGWGWEMRDDGVATIIRRERSCGWFCLHLTQLSSPIPNKSSSQPREKELIWDPLSQENERLRKKLQNREKEMKEQVEKIGMNLEKAEVLEKSG